MTSALSAPGIRVSWFRGESCPGCCANPLCAPRLTDAEAAAVGASPWCGDGATGKAVSLELPRPRAAVPRARGEGKRAAGSALPAVCTPLLPAAFSLPLSPPFAQVC